MTDAEIVEDRTIAPGDWWSGVVERGHILRLVDLEGQQAVDFLCYDAADPSERYNAADTMKIAGSLFVAEGMRLYSDRGNVRDALPCRPGAHQIDNRILDRVL